MDTNFEGLRMKIKSELRRFFVVDSREAVKIGDLEDNSAAIKVVRPKFSKGIDQNAAIREGVDELTLREGEEGTLRSFNNTTNVGDRRWWAPLVDEEWNAIVRPSTRASRERHGRICTSMFVSQEEAAGQRRFGGQVTPRRDATRTTTSAGIVEQTLAESSTGLDCSSAES